MSSMTRVPGWRRYLRFFGPDVDRDVDDELRFHLEMRARDYAARGLPPDAARRAAYERFGDYDSVQTALRAHDQELVRIQQRRDFVDDLIQDLKCALRSLRRAPGFTLVAVATLGLGVGANTAVFSIVDAVLLRALPYPNPEQLAAVAGAGAVLAEATRIRELSRSFTDVATYRATSVGLSGDGEPERLDVTAVSANLFSTLGVGAAMGRTFAGDENVAGHTNVVVLSNGLWIRRFGGDRRVVGRNILIEGAPFTVVGVMPADFAFPSRDTQLWLPYTLPASRSGMFWGYGGYQIVGRLRAGVTAAAAQQELRVVMEQIRHENPIWTPGPAYVDQQSKVAPLQQQLVGTAQTMLLLLLGVVGVVLLIACANVANLLLVRATARRKEIAVRMALGGGRGRLLRQLMTESVVLAALGGICGVALAWLGMRAVVSILPADIPRMASIAIDRRVLAFTTVLVVLTGVAFGLLPALRASGENVQQVLRDGSRTAGGSHRRLASLLVCGEIAAAVLLVTAAFLLVRSMWALHDVDPGFRTASIVTARVNPPAKRFADPATLQPFVDGLLHRVSALPGVESAAAVNFLPMTPGRGGLAVRIGGQFEDIRANLPMADHYQIATPRYLGTMGISLLSGRGFADTDVPNAPQVVVVSESFARHFWPNASAIGQRIGYPWPSDWMTIVGVVKDAKLDSLTGKAEETVYRPFAQAPTNEISLVVRSTIDPLALATAVRAAVAQIDPGTPVSNVELMRTVVDRSAARQQFTMLLLTIFAAIALLLGVVGIYGVMSYAVAQRTREIGVRMALGASPGDALRMVLRDGLTLAGAGIVVGLVAAAGAARAMSGLLYGVTATDPITFVAVPVALGLVALMASYLPARRATRVDPTTALRGD
ncbi:MAG: permease [Gemmatimonadetes bacterium]|nr:permease [Gemmatimonadota bacterium]